ncbi:MAG: cation diffusion facilitator family transporter [Dysgonamonadaceae bacterium]|jgi:cobalt-zinc-cadmium efflux system protein|nr:cation diffusion facilitator family transporter [Dysgonamonadaceae bacterium]
MSHNHSHHHSHSHNHSHEDVKNIKTAFGLNLAFTIIELVGGLFTNSIAIISDAVHDFGDSISLAMAWYFQRLSKKRSNAKYSYGYKRFSLLGAIVNATVLIVGSIFILSEAIPRLFNPQQPDATGMFWLAILGILANGAAVLKTKKGKSINERVVSLHLLEDVLGWVAVLLGAIIMYFFDLPIIDPVLSVAISAFVIFNVFRNMRSAFRIILQGTPRYVEQQHIIEKILQIEEVTEVHDFHLWSLDEEYNISSIHIVLKTSLSMEELAQLKHKIRILLASENIQHATIEFETSDEKCMLNCNSLQQ